MNSMFFSGETEGRAVLAAANHFGVSPDRIEFDRVEKRHGFVKHRRVVIRVDPERVGSDGEADAGGEGQGGQGDAGDAVASAASAGSEVVGAAAPASEALPESPAVEVEEALPEEAPREERSEEAAAGDARSDEARPEEAPAGDARSDEAQSDEALPEEVQAEEAQAGDARSEPAPREEMRHEQDSGEILETARAALDQLLELADLEVSAEVVLAGERLEVELEGVDQELLVEDEGQVLLALQHLLPRVMYGDLGRIVPCRLDCGGYQRKKEERLRGLARRVAEEVVRRGGARTLRPMNPADRRIVHITLADDPDVETESQGNGYFKRVSIRLL